MHRLWMAMLLATGCGDKDDTGEDSGSPGLGSGVRYPSGDEIMIFTGHGGADGDGGAPGTMDLVAAHWESTYGYTVRYKDELPSEVAKYRAIIMMAPGYYGGAAPFSKGEVLQLQEMLAQGARVILLMESGTCGDAQVNQLLADLGTTITMNGSGADETRLFTINKFNYDSQVNDNLTEVILHGPCYIDPGADGAALLADEDGNVVGAYQYPGPGGDVVIIGDFRFVDDTGYREEADNATLADNLITIEP